MHPAHRTNCGMHGRSVKASAGQIDAPQSRHLHVVEVMLPVHEHDRRAEAEADRKIPEPGIVGEGRRRIHDHDLWRRAGRPFGYPPRPVVLLAGTSDDFHRLAIHRRLGVVVPAFCIVWRDIAGNLQERRLRRWRDDAPEANESKAYDGHGLAHAKARVDMVKTWRPPQIRQPTRSGCGRRAGGRTIPRGCSAIKQRYDPDGLFFVRHGVGSEGWSEDGFTQLAGR